MVIKYQSACKIAKNLKHIKINQLLNDDFPVRTTGNGSDGGLQHGVIQKHCLAQLLSGLAGGNAVKKVASEQNQNS